MAADLTPKKRVRCLTDHCSTDIELREFVERLPAHLDSGMLLPPLPTTSATDPERGIPKRIGSDETLGKIGEGGMGK
jgi:hypothetical protein